MLRQIIRMSEFKKDFEKWKEFQYHTDPYLRCAMDSLSKEIEEASEEAILASVLRTGKVDIRKDE